MARAINRRAALGAVFAGGAAGAIASLPATAAAQPSALTAIDRRILELWRRRARLLAIVDSIAEQNEPENAALNERWDAANAAIGAVEKTLEEHIGGSVLALGALMLRTIDDDQRHDIIMDSLWLPHTVLRALRAHLVGPIAEDADRVLAEDEESA